MFDIAWNIQTSTFQAARSASVPNNPTDRRDFDANCVRGWDKFNLYGIDIAHRPFSIKVRPHTPTIDRPDLT